MKTEILLKNKEKNNFALELFKFLYDHDKLASITNYFILTKKKYKVHHKGKFDLRGLFLSCSEEKLLEINNSTVRNNTKTKQGSSVKDRVVARWHNFPFNLNISGNPKTFYLSNQWSEGGKNSNPTIEELKNVLRYCYSNYLIEKRDGEYCLIDKSATLLQPIEPQMKAPFLISQILKIFQTTNLIYSSSLIKRFVFSLLTKPFVILSGLAGSGKTQLAVAFAKALSESSSQYRIVSVGADWTNREPLLGFPNALQKNEYVKPENGVLQLLIDANNNPDKPYFLILDEMNLSYVERYFADFLSVMESHGEIALWEKPEDSDDSTPDTVKLPKNLFIIGTINVDETTYMFSPKVLDRANVIEFKISFEEMLEFLGSVKKIDTDAVKGKAASMGGSFVEIAGNKDLSSSDEIKSTLALFFKELKSVNAEFGYRSATEIYRFISQAKTNDDTSAKLKESEILDAAIVQKLLPKLHGSRKKLEPVLKKLWALCMPDGFNEIGYTQELATKAKYPMSADKIARMYAAAQDNGFTSFAEA